ncbi:MAG TPA: helical backbone metal receptor [Thermoanaerobaculia bacterium]|nr:helical backbone metal receptor [Thermoanaerobaculia bacterium]
MRRRSLTLLAILSIFFVVAGCARSGAPQRAAIPRRVVALAPNLTEIVFAVGAGDRLVGVSDYSDYPPAARAIPRVGGLEVSAERVASLSPDLVLATPEGNAKSPVAALAAAGVPVLAVPGGSLDDVLRAIDMIARRLGKGAEGERLVGALAARREAVRRARPAGPLPTAAVLIWPDPPQGAGAGTFLNDVLTEAGARNALADRPGWPLVSEEWLATTPLGVLVLPDSDQTRAAYQRALASGPLSRGMAARARLIRIDESELTRPGPRVFDALERLAAALRAGPAGVPRERR